MGVSPAGLGRAAALPCPIGGSARWVVDYPGGPLSRRDGSAMRRSPPVVLVRRGLVRWPCHSAAAAFLHGSLHSHLFLTLAARPDSRNLVPSFSL